MGKEVKYLIFEFYFFSKYF